MLGDHSQGLLCTLNSHFDLFNEVMNKPSTGWAVSGGGSLEEATPFIPLGQKGSQWPSGPPLPA
jgi:hypothetical protein